MQWPWSKRPAKRREEPAIPEGAVRLRLRYVGKVQAVGFRFTAEGCASEAGVTGYARNLTDGSVQCEVQGTPRQVSEFKRLLQEAIDSDRTWIEGWLAEEESVEPVPERGFRLQGI